MGKSLFGQRAASAQSLLEFTMAAMLMSLLFLAAWHVGVASHVGGRAASAIQEPATQKLQLANIPGDSTTIATGLINTFNQQGLALFNPSLDSVSVQSKAMLNSVLIGNKANQVNLPGLKLSFNFTTTQVLPGALLKANDATGRTSGSGAYPGIHAKNYPALLQASDFGFSEANFPFSIPMSRPDCIDTTMVSIADFNTLMAPSTPLSAFPAIDSASTVPYSTTYTDKLPFDATVLHQFTAIPNSVCDVLPASSTTATPAPTQTSTTSTSTTSPSPEVMACKYQLASRLLRRWADRIKTNEGCYSQTGFGEDVTYATNTPAY